MRYDPDSARGRDLRARCRRYFARHRELSNRKRNAFTNADGSARNRNANADDDAHGWIVCDDQNPPRARLLAALALTRPTDAAALQAVFWRY